MSNNLTRPPGGKQGMLLTLDHNPKYSCLAIISDLTEQATRMLDEEARIDATLPSLKRQDAIKPRPPPRRPSTEPTVLLDSSMIQWDQQSLNSSLADPVSTSSGEPSTTMSEEDFLQIKRSLPALNKLSEKFLRNTPTETLLALNRQMLAVETAGSQTSKNLERQLIENNRRSHEVRTFPEGKDDNRELLHEARFLPAPATSAGQIQAIYKRIYPDGQIPLNYHDMGAMGLEGHITPKVSFLYFFFHLPNTILWMS